MTASGPDEPSDFMRQLTERGSRVRPLDDATRSALLAQFRQRTSQRVGSTRRSGLVLGVALTSLAALVAVVVLRRTDEPRPAPVASATEASQAADRTVEAVSPRQISFGSRGEIDLSADAIARIPTNVAAAGGSGPLEVSLERGRLTASVAPRRRDEPLSIVTPHLTVVVIGTRFTVSVASGLTTVSVAHGRVRIDRGQQSVFVDGGQSLRSDDLRLATAAPLGAAAAPTPCTNVPRRTHCLRKVARGSDLSAQNALFALALHARDVERDPDAALSFLRSYVRRFADGVLSEDAVLLAARILHERGRSDESCAYLRRHLGASEVARVGRMGLPSACSTSATPTVR